MFNSVCDRTLFRQKNALRQVLLCLVEIVGSSVVYIVAESGSNHGKGLQVGVVLLQLARLLKKSGSVCHKRPSKRLNEKRNRMRNEAHKQQGEHGLSNVEAVSPVVVGDVTVTLPNGEHPSRYDLQGGKQEQSEVQYFTTERTNTMNDLLTRGLSPRPAL